MPHHIYQTTGFVIGSRAFGEADKIVHILTEELGLVAAVAKSVRSEKSKLRSSLQDFAYSRIDLVRGKEAWRVTDAEEIMRLSPNDGPEKLRALAGMFALLRRFVHGEERDEELFLAVRDAFLLLRGKKLSEEELKDLEIFSAFKILTLLGYAEWNNESGLTRREATERINRAIAESHL